MSQELNNIFFALSDPIRRDVIERLSIKPESVTALSSSHTIALPSFMKHLKVLEKAGLIHSLKKGRIRICQLEESPLLSAQGWLEWQRVICEKSPKE